MKRSSPLLAGALPLALILAVAHKSRKRSGTSPATIPIQAQILRNRTVAYFFNEFIDSTAIEGGAPALATWKSEKLAAGAFVEAPFHERIAG